MSAIRKAFARAKAARRAAFIPFLVAGHPDLETTELLLPALADAGADIIELGVPFSDPIADGPVIQRAATRALAAGTTLDKVLATVARVRARVEAPIVLFTYFNPIHARGAERFAEQAAASGIDGVLCVDLPPEEGKRELVPALARHGLDAIFLLAPTSDKRRVARVAAVSSGFVYYVSTMGTTGERARLPRELQNQVRAVRRQLDQPLAVGFGISTPEQANTVAQFADGVVVGSALVRLIDELEGEDDMIEVVHQRASELAAAMGKRKRGLW